MNIELHDITVRDLVEDYEDNAEQGVRAYGGKLDVRPPYQREFVYGEKQRAAVIDTLRKGFPLNVMYWAVREDDTYEIIDGQQRTISICQFVDGEFAFEGRYFHNLQKDEQEQVLNYALTVYLCSGDDSEKLDWFETINIAGMELSKQELRNAVYSGSWVTDAKRYFSKTNCPAINLGADYVDKKPLRQELLELVIKWVNDDKVEDYMARNQHTPAANELWLYFQNVINWAKVTFPTSRPSLTKRVPWGPLYNEFKDAKHDPAALEAEIEMLILDDDVTSQRGIYSYVLTRNEKHLSLRAFSDAERLTAYTRQKGICPMCKQHFELSEMEADHITPWSKGGKTVADNCKMLCKEDNRRKWDV